MSLSLGTFWISTGSSASSAEKEDWQGGVFLHPEMVTFALKASRPPEHGIYPLILFSIKNSHTLQGIPHSLEAI